MDYIENINASNYLRGLKEVQPAIKVNKSDRILGILFLCGAFVVGVLTVVDFVDGMPNIFGIIWTIMLLLLGLGFSYMSKISIKNAEAFARKLEEEMCNVALVTKRIVISKTGIDDICGRFDREKRQAVNSDFSAMYMQDVKRKIYRFNGIVLEFAPFSYGMELEITYYANTKVINSIQIVEQ